MWNALTLNLVFLPLVLNMCRMWSTKPSATNRKYDHQWQRGPEWGVAVASVSAIQHLWPHLWREHYPPQLGTDCRPLCWLGHSCIVSTCHRVVSVYFIKKCCQHIGGNVMYTHTKNLIVNIMDHCNRLLHIYIGKDFV